MKKSSYIHLLTFILTFIGASIIYKIAGLKYRFSNGLNINLLFDLLLWGVLYFTFDWILNRYMKG
ncbi:hypothetical protein GCM10008904_10520 [Paraclostridium ghonii]|uniref:Uncharacterized protein n=1 Tax=Paraclostridium ghonii TaxID=29358 RepID=A0ABU0MZ90_9FIRM|nr:hypothetical protein [Paeniclostridium ghonii]MDQ0555919.1 hypothetical protein [Paeniclostridium ghonii]